MWFGPGGSSVPGVRSELGKLAPHVQQSQAKEAQAYEHFDRYRKLDLWTVFLSGTDGLRTAQAPAMWRDPVLE